MSTLLVNTLKPATGGTITLTCALTTTGSVSIGRLSGSSAQSSVLLGDLVIAQKNGTAANLYVSGSTTIAGNLTVNGTTTTVATTNTVVKDSLIELNNGASSNSNDCGIVIERGSTGDNAIFMWDEGADTFQVGTTTATGASTGNLTVTDAALKAGSLDISGNIDVDGVTNLDAVDIDGAVQVDATVTVGVDDTGYDVKFFGATSGQYMLWDESADELVLAGDSKLSFHDAAGGENIIATSNGHLEVNAGTTLDMTAPTIDMNASTKVNIDGVVDITDTTDSSDATGDTGALRCEGGASIAKKLYVGTDLDVDGTTNLDAVDIDGAVQIDNTITVGANDQGYDIIFYGDTASANVTWDTSADDLILNGAAGLIVPDGQLTLGSTAVSSTAAELNKLDGVTAGTVAASKALVVDGNKDLGTLRNLTIDGTFSDGNYTFDTSGNVTGLGTVACGAITTSGVFDVTDTTDSSDATGDTGALRCEGGASIAKKLYVGTDLDVDGTTNLDAVDVDGAVQIDNTVTVGVDDTGYDVKFFGATSGQYMLWDQSADELVLTGDSKLSFNDAAGGENIVASADGHLEINSGTTIDMTAGSTVDINANTCTIDAQTTIREKLQIDIPARSVTPSATDGSVVHIEGGETITDSNTSASGTATGFNMVSIEAPTLAASNSSVTTTNAATLFVSGAPTAGTNQTITNAHAIFAKGAVTVGVDDTGHDVKFYGNTSGAYMLWDTSADDLVLAGAAGIDLEGDLDVNGTANLDNTDIDGTFTMDGTAFDVNATSTCTIDNSNTSNGIAIGTATSGVPISIGHTTSEVTVNDNLTVTGDLTVNGATTTVSTTNMLVEDSLIELNTGAGSNSNDCGIVIERGSTGDNAIFMWDEGADTFQVGTTTATGASTGNLTVTDAALKAGSLDISGDIDVDGTTNLDAVDIDGAVQIDSTVTVGVNDTGYDVKFFGATSGKYMLWDESKDELTLAGRLSQSDAGGTNVFMSDVIIGSRGNTYHNLYVSGGVACGTLDMYRISQSYGGYPATNIFSEDVILSKVNGGNNANLLVSGSAQIETTLDVNGAVDCDVTTFDVAASGDIDLVSTNNGASAIHIEENGGTSGTIKIYANQGNTDGSAGAGSILLASDAGGLGFSWNDAKDLWAEGGKFIVTANEDASECIKLHADAGTSQTIQIINDAGTTDGTEGAGAIDIEATAGGISIHAADDKDIWVEGGQAVITANHDTAAAIKLHADAGTSQTIQIINDAGTTDGTEGAGAIDIEATTGGISLHAADDKDIWVEGGQAVVTANHNTAGAIKLHADAGANQTILIVNDEGTTDGSEGAGAINIEATVGGISLHGADDKDISIEAGQVVLTANHNTSESIKLHADAGADQTIQIINDAGTTDGSEGAGAIDIEATVGGISLHGADDKDISIEAGQVVITANHNTSESIKLHADAGAAQTIQIINDAGTTDGTEGAGAIDIEATTGGISIHAADDKDIWVEGGQAVVTANHNTAGAIKLHADAGSSQTILLLNDEGTGADSIDIVSTVGGITLETSQAADFVTLNSRLSQSAAAGTNIFMSDVIIGQKDNSSYYSLYVSGGVTAGTLDPYQVSQSYGGYGATNFMANSLVLGKINGGANADLYVSGNIGIGMTPTKPLDITADTGGFPVQVINDGDHIGRKGIKIQCGKDSIGGGDTNVYLLCNDGNGDASGQLQDAGGTFSAADTSDRRLKQNIADTELGGLETINNMQVRDFEWKKSGHKTTGFIAQEMKEAFAMAASGDESGDPMEDPMMIMRDVIVIPLVKAVQELSEKVDKQSAQIKKLETQLKKKSGK